MRRTGFDKATVFRNLVTLSEEGFLRRTDLGDHVWRFEAISDEGATGVTHEHPHFLCTGCGTVECIPSLQVTVSGRRGLPRAVRRRDIEVQLKGLCDACLD
jgi:Fur family ferric uptake transcriptional regulator